MTDGPQPRVLHVASGRLDARVRDGIAELVGSLDGTVGSHRLVTSPAGRRVVRRVPPDLVVAHGAAALVATATRRRRRPPVIYHPLPRADAHAPWPRLADIARDRATLLLTDAAATPDRWTDAVVALTGPIDPPAHPPGSMDDVLHPGPRVFRRSEDVLMVAGPAVDEPPLLLTGLARSAFEAVDGRRRLRDIVHDLAGDHADPAEVEAIVWDVATRGVRLGVLA